MVRWVMNKKGLGRSQLRLWRAWFELKFAPLRKSHLRSRYKLNLKWDCISKKECFSCRRAHSKGFPRFLSVPAPWAHVIRVDDFTPRLWSPHARTHARKVSWQLQVVEEQPSQDFRAERSITRFVLLKIFLYFTDFSTVLWYQARTSLILEYRLPALWVSSRREMIYFCFRLF